MKNHPKQNKVLAITSKIQASTGRRRPARLWRHQRPQARRRSRTSDALEALDALGALRCGGRAPTGGGPKGAGEHREIHEEEGFVCDFQDLV